MNDFIAANPHHIKTAGRIFLIAVTQTVIIGSAANPPLFPYIHSLQRMLSAAPAIFYFHKHQIILLSCHQINFPNPAAKISMQNLKTFLH